MKTLILGMGNEILGDEGVGVHAVRALRTECLPEDVEVLEVGTAILDALPALETPQRIIIIDAMQAQGPAGSVYRTCLADCSGSALIASMHGFNIFRVLALAGRTDTPEMIVFGVEPAVIDWALELSPAVQEAIPYLLAAVNREITSEITRGEQQRLCRKFSSPNGSAGVNESTTA